jgi:carboxypeptidase family protein
MNLSSRFLSARNNANDPADRHRRPALEALEDRTLPSTTGLSAITSNFNGTAVPAGSTVWFNSVAKVSGVGPSGATLHLVNSEIDFTAGGTAYHLSVPNATLTFSPIATQATTSFDPTTNTWDTTVPLGLGGNTFLSGYALPVPSGLPGGINPVSWTGTFQSDTAGVSVNWQWAAAVYTSFGGDYNALNVKPVDSNQASAYKNSDHAGTPEAFRAFVIGGARGGGGSNWTGSYSATASVQPGPYAPPLSSLSGSVLDETTGGGLSGVTVTLTTTNSLGQTVVVATTTTDANGDFSFTGLTAGNYTITESPGGFTNDVTNNVIGSAGGSTGGDLFNVTLGTGVNGTGYKFTDVLAGS